MIETLLLIGGVWFWTGAIVFGVLMLAFVEFEKPLMALIAIVLFGIFLYFVGKVNVFDWIANNWGTALLYLLGYLLVGVVWSVIKWFFHVYNMREKYKRARKEFMASSSNVGKSPEQMNEALRNSYGARHYVPDVSDARSKIILWMAYWPFSALWTLINDPLRRFWRLAYRTISGMLESIVKGAYKDFEELKEQKK